MSCNEATIRLLFHVSVLGWNVKVPSLILMGAHILASDEVPSLKRRKIVISVIISLEYLGDIRSFINDVMLTGSVRIYDCDTFNFGHIPREISFLFIINIFGTLYKRGGRILAGSPSR